jgi:gamma-glutamylcyclotransferase (GGCT)/AIG2-like uncharacterized protein YtfP
MLESMATVFVYGTLLRGEANDIVLAAQRHGIAAPQRLGPAMVRGALYDFGSYPGLVPDPHGAAVRGDVYRIDAALVPVLDEIEEVYPGQEGLFVQRRIGVEVDGSEREGGVGGIGRYDCLFYPVAPAATVGLPVIASGDWRAHRRARVTRAA